MVIPIVTEGWRVWEGTRKDRWEISKETGEA